MNISYPDIARVCGGQLLLDHPPADNPSGFYYDSRLIPDYANASAIFLGIETRARDGNIFATDAYAKGVRCFILERAQHLEGAWVLVVENTVEAIQKLATHYRSTLKIPVIAITGSNGKTIVKEWLATLLQGQYNVCRSPASFNSQLGVPLSILSIDRTHSLAVIEAGVSQAGEMQKLECCIQPTTGIFTNIGQAHDDGFDSMEEKISEKCQLFVSAQYTICSDSERFVDTLRNVTHVITWGKEGSIPIWFEGSTIHFGIGDTVHHFEMQFRDTASQQNLAQCVALLITMDYAAKDIIAGLRLLNSIPGRLMVRKGHHMRTIIDDSYNNDLTGLEHALKYASQVSSQDLIAIITDLVSTRNKDIIYAQVSDLLREANPTMVITVGSDHHLADDTRSRHLHFENTASLIQNLDQLPANTRVLVKGARKFNLERVVQRLLEKSHDSRLEVNMSHIVQNLNRYRQQIKPETRVMVMLKALGYGSNSTELARLMDFQDVDYLGVAYADEGTELRQQGIELPIMVMNPSVASIPTMIMHRLEPMIYNNELLKAYKQATPGDNGIHLKFDTGMHRLGFSVDEAVDVLNECSDMVVSGVMTHLAASDNPEHDDFTLQQLDRFGQCVALVRERYPRALAHALNSAGIVRFPDHQHDLVRMGIGLHGIDPAGTIGGLAPVSRWIATVSQVIKIRKGESVGYNRSVRVDKDTRVATLSVGYADGYHRKFGNGKGVVWWSGALLPTLGNICMDMTMIDATGTQLEVGDEVELFGPNLSISRLAELGGSIPYEILTSVGPRVERVFIYG